MRHALDTGNMQQRDADTMRHRLPTLARDVNALPTDGSADVPTSASVSTVRPRYSTVTVGIAMLYLWI